MRFLLAMTWWDLLMEPYPFRPWLLSLNEEPNLVYFYRLQQDKLLLRAIIASTSDSVISPIVSPMTSCKVWEKLAYLVPNKVHLRLISLKEHLMLTKHDPCLVVEYLRHMKCIVDEFVLVNTPIDEDDLILHIFISPGPGFNKDFCCNSSWRYLLAFEEVYDKLIKFKPYLKREEVGSEVPMASINFAKKSRSDTI